MCHDSELSRQQSKADEGPKEHAAATGLVNLLVDSCRSSLFLNTGLGCDPGWSPSEAGIGRSVWEKYKVILWTSGQVQVEAHLHA